MSVNKWQLDGQIGQKFSLIWEKEKIMDVSQNFAWWQATNDLLQKTCFTCKEYEIFTIGSYIKQYSTNHRHLIFQSSNGLSISKKKIF